VSAEGGEKGRLSGGRWWFTKGIHEMMIENVKVRLPKESQDYSLAMVCCLKATIMPANLTGQGYTLNK
jgi:hypothetical protein